jgi:hypothetical protein
VEVEDNTIQYNTMQCNTADNTSCSAIRLKLL